MTDLLLIYSYAMYTTGTSSVTMWKLSENTVAGDLGVTVFIQVSFERATA